ncbi:hypothetical protein UlMin_006801 [Ulmus minor]
MANYCPKAVSFFGALQRIYSLFQLLQRDEKSLQSMCNVSLLSHCRKHIGKVVLRVLKHKEDAKTKIDAKTLATYNIQNVEFLLGMVIWYDLLYVVNNVSKILQREDMQIDVASRELKKTRFEEAMINAKEIASEMEIEPVFMEKQTLDIKKQLDESVSEVVTQSAVEPFKVNYFLHIIDHALSSFKTIDLAMLYVEKDIVGKIDYASLINIFASKIARRAIFK